MLSCAVRTSSTMRAYWLSLARGGGADGERAVEVEAAAQEPACPGAAETGSGSPVRRAASTCERPASTSPSQGTSSPGRTQELVAHRHRVGLDILGAARAHPMGQPGRRRLQLADRLGRAPLGVALERLAAGLHQHDDEAGERLAEEQRGDDGEHRDEVGREASRRHAAQRAPDDRQRR